MFKLFEYYKLMKEEFKNEHYLKSCIELYEKSKYRGSISSCLKQLGFKCSVKQEAIIFFALVDILIVVGKDNNFYYVTLSTEKINDLKLNGRLLPRSDDNSNNDKSNSIIYGNTIDVINDYLSRGKFHFIKLNRLSCSSFFCSLGTMNPYPSLNKHQVYSVDFISKVFWDTCRVLVRGLYKVNDLVCTISPLSTQGQQINTCPMDCKLNVKTLDGVLESIYLWDIKDISFYVESEKLKPLYEGVCLVDNTLVTLNRDILERYYGTSYMDFESQSVRERYCLEELYGRGDSASLRYYINKYHFHSDKEILSCQSIHSLRDILVSRLKPITYREGLINLRVLTSPNQIYSKHKSYYRATKVDSDFEVIKDLNEIMPKIYTVGGVCSFGYVSVKVRAVSPANAETEGKKEIIRRFGNLYSNKVLGLQIGENSCEGYHKVFNIPTEVQRQICDTMRKSYTDKYSEYSKQLLEILSMFDLVISDDVIQLLFVNKLAKKVGKCRNITLEEFSTCLEKFLNMLSKSSQDKLDKKVLNERKKLKKKGK